MKHGLHPEKELPDPAKNPRAPTARAIALAMTDKNRLERL